MTRHTNGQYKMWKMREKKVLIRAFKLLIGAIAVLTEVEKLGEEMLGADLGAALIC